MVCGSHWSVGACQKMLKLGMSRSALKIGNHHGVWEGIISMGQSDPPQGVYHKTGFIQRHV